MREDMGRAAAVQAQGSGWQRTAAFTLASYNTAAVEHSTRLELASAAHRLDCRFAAIRRAWHPLSPLAGFGPMLSHLSQQKPKRSLTEVRERPAKNSAR